MPWATSSTAATGQWFNLYDSRSRIPEEVCLSFISAQDHACNRLLHALYAPRKRLSSTLGPRAATGMRDAGYELGRILIPRTWVNKGTKKGRRVEIHREFIAACFNGW